MDGLDVKEEEAEAIKLEELVPTGSDYSLGSDSGMEELYKELEKENIFSVKRGRLLNEFDKKEMNLCVRLSKVLLRRKDFGQLLSACAAIRDQVNENMFANALQMVIMNRTDLGNSIPLLHQYIPRESDLKDALESSQDYQWQGRPGGRGRGRGRSRASRDLVI